MSQLKYKMDILYAGLESLLGIEISKGNDNSSNVSYKDYSSIVHGVNHDYKYTTSDKINKNTNNNGYKSNVEDLKVFVRNISGKLNELKTSSNNTVWETKNQIFNSFENNLKPEDIILFYGSKTLENGKQLKEYDIRNESTIVLFISTNKYQLIDVFSPEFNFDFKGVKDVPNSHFRGGHVYNRPCGSSRYALKVLGRFGNTPGGPEVWLGASNSKASGEWAVSYHSSLSLDEMKKILVKLNLPVPSKTTTLEDEYCFTTPSWIVAKKNAKTFTYNGEKYYIIFQNRINPNTFQKYNTSSGEEYWKSPNLSEDHIRPYSILVGKV